MDTHNLKPRTALELIDASFQFLRENFAVLFTVTAVTYAPIALAQYLAATHIADAGMSLGTMIVSWVFSAMAQAATIEIVAARYMGESITPADALRAVWRRLATVLGVTLYYGIYVALATMLFIIPGIYVATKYFGAMAAAMVEGQTMNDAMKRSATLTDGSKRRVLNIFGLTLIIYFMLNAAITGIAAAFMSAPMAMLMAQVARAITNPFIYILVTLVYFDLRIRREGLDFDAMLAPTALGAAGSPAPTAQAAGLCTPPPSARARRSRSSTRRSRSTATTS
jgi:hypothetical protein